VPDRHDLPAFARATVEVNLGWLLDEEQLPDPIRELYLWSDQDSLQVIGIVVAGADDEACEIVHGDVPDTTLPLDGHGDEPLGRLVRRHGLDDRVSWGDSYEVPECLYRMEMVRCAHAVAEAARGRGVPFADDAEVGILIEDESYHDPGFFEACARAALGRLRPQVARELLALYYPDPDATGLLTPQVPE
jgi:hypothetical protein